MIFFFPLPALPHPPPGHPLSLNVPGGWPPVGIPSGRPLGGPNTHIPYMYVYFLILVSFRLALSKSRNAKNLKKGTLPSTRHRTQTIPLNAALSIELIMLHFRLAWPPIARIDAIFLLRNVHFGKCPFWNARLAPGTLLQSDPGEPQKGPKPERITEQLAHTAARLVPMSCVPKGAFPKVDIP